MYFWTDFGVFLNNNKDKIFNHYSIALNTDRSKLYETINRRVDLMIDSGLIDEAKELYKYKNNNALNTVGYKELFNYFQNKLCYKIITKSIIQLGLMIFLS